MRSPSRLSSCLLLIAGVLAVYLLNGTRDIALPGVYMDAVNPDYLVAKVLNRNHAEPLVAWVLPGNYLRQRIPILISLYHGLQQFWIGLPLYAVFGMSVAGIRLTHIVFAAGVLVSALVLMRGARVPAWIVGLAGVAMASDPSFIFAFRTQSYITLAPTMWLLLSIHLLWKIEDAHQERRRRLIIASGICYGLSVLGYFVYIFYCPALLSAVALRLRQTTDSPPRSQQIFIWLIAALIGSAYYLLGYALLARAQGGTILGFLHYLSDYSARLGAFGTDLSLAERLGVAGSFVHSIFSNSWHHSLMFGSLEPVEFSTLKLIVLLLLPALLLLHAEVRGHSTALLRLAVALLASFFIASLLFGDRLGGHHYASMLPVSYVALAAALAGLLRDSHLKPATGVVAGALCLGVLVAINVVAKQREFETLQRTGGVGLFSDAINRLAEDLAAMPRKPFVFFPDWGLAFPVILISGGSVPASADVDLTEALRYLCSGNDVAFAVLGSDRSTRIASWTTDLRWSAPRVTAYRQRDGITLLELATFSGARYATQCSEATLSDRIR